MANNYVAKHATALLMFVPLAFYGLKTNNEEQDIELNTQMQKDELMQFIRLCEVNKVVTTY